jgi:hypothetical protein
MGGGGRELPARTLLDATNVSVDGQHGRVEGEVRDRRRGVAADSGELGEILRPAFVGDPLCRPVEVDGAPVVPTARYSQPASRGSRST